MNQKNKTSVFFSSLLLSLALLAPAAHAGKILSGDEVKSLITGKTISVTHGASGAKWKAYFAADGSAALDNSANQESWHIDDKGRHCNTGVPLVCAPISDNGDGTYSRLKQNGDVAVIWTKIEDGKTF